LASTVSVGRAGVAVVAVSVSAMTEEVKVVGHDERAEQLAFAEVGLHLVFVHHLPVDLVAGCIDGSGCRRSGGNDAAQRADAPGQGAGWSTAASAWDRSLPSRSPWRRLQGVAVYDRAVAIT
jgi:hypothetical protein